MTQTEGIYLIDSGRCKVVNPHDTHVLTSIQRGDYFGASHYLKTPVSLFKTYI